MRPTATTPKPPPSPADLLSAQHSRQRTLSLILTVCLIGEVLMLLGGLGLLLILGSGGIPPEDQDTAQRILMPSVRLLTVYTALLLLVTFMTRRAVKERWRTARRWNVGLVVALAAGIPVGTALAVALLLILAPARWVDERPAAPRGQPTS